MRMTKGGKKSIRCGLFIITEGAAMPRQRESKMKKATYEQLVKVAVEYANNNNCSYAIAAKLYKVAKGDVLAFQGAVR
jgi:hypothetical protein